MFIWEKVIGPKSPSGELNQVSKAQSGILNIILELYYNVSFPRQTLETLVFVVWTFPSDSAVIGSKSWHSTTFYKPSLNRRMVHGRPDVVYSLFMHQVISLSAALLIFFIATAAHTICWINTLNNKQTVKQEFYGIKGSKKIKSISNVRYLLDRGPNIQPEAYFR